MTGQQMKAWHFKPGLVSLRDVQVYVARRLITIAQDITSCHLACAFVFDEKDFSSEKRTKAKTLLIGLANEAEAISLNFTAKLARRISQSVETDDSDTVNRALSELDDRLIDETESLKFFHVKSEKITWFDNTEPAGEQFKANFPKANAELIEAGNCFALDRYTACVFHLTRALEIVLSSLHRTLGIPEPADEHDKTWGRTLGRIADKIKENEKSPPAGWNNDVEFFKKVYGLLVAAKTPFRDTTIHVASVYDETGAGGVLMAVVGTLSHVATKLKEKP